VAGVLETLIELEEVGRLALKGFARPVPTFNALGLKTPAPAGPLRPGQDSQQEA
jgi:hypothetical protein